MAFQKAQIATIPLLVLALAACSSRSSGPDLAPGEPMASQPIEQPDVALPEGPLTAVQITNALKERNFNYVAGSRKGKITYFSDGTTSYVEVGKGEGTGLWQASDGKLCEARNPTRFLPKGTPSTCSAFAASGNTYTAGSMKLTPG